MPRTIIKTDLSQTEIKLEAEAAEEPECPDSTSHERDFARRPFCEGEDILVHDRDQDLIYFGIVVEVDHEARQCLVRFGDSTERWSSFYELRRLGEPDAGGGQQDAAGGEAADEDGRSASLLELHQELARTEEVKLPQHVKEARKQLSYEFESLVWDSEHQRNESEMYCYCGERGDWYKKMLQCLECLQWFHQECIRALPYQLMNGDRFFHFVCTLCNGKQEETISRLDLTLTDAVHLVLFNLTHAIKQNYHDLETAVLPCLRKRFKYLSGYGGTAGGLKACRLEPEAVRKALTNNKSRFKCGSETGKKNSLWALRRMSAPALPSKHMTATYGRWASTTKKAAAVAAAASRKGGVVHKRRPYKGPVVGSKMKHRGRLKHRDLSRELSDSDTSSRGTLDFLIKTPKDFCGANNPFRSLGHSGIKCEMEMEGRAEADLVRGDTTPNSSSTIKRFLSSEKESPISSGAPSTAATDESRSEMFQSVEDMLLAGEDFDTEVEGSEDGQFKTPGLLSGLKGSSVKSYFAPSAKTRIARGEKFKVKARRLTLNGDIAYLIEWEHATT